MFPIARSTYYKKTAAPYILACMLKQKDKSIAVEQFLSNIMCLSPDTAVVIIQ